MSISQTHTPLVGWLCVFCVLAGAGILWQAKPKDSVERYWQQLCAIQGGIDAPEEHVTLNQSPAVELRCVQSRLSRPTDEVIPLVRDANISVQSDHQVDTWTGVHSEAAACDVPQHSPRVNVDIGALNALSSSVVDMLYLAGIAKETSYLDVIFTTVNQHDCVGFTGCQHTGMDGYDVDTTFTVYCLLQQMKTFMGTRDSFYDVLQQFLDGDANTRNVLSVEQKMRSAGLDPINEQIRLALFACKNLNWYLLTGGKN